jgi:hypothetical protein
MWETTKNFPSSKPIVLTHPKIQWMVNNDAKTSNIGEPVLIILSAGKLSKYSLCISLYVKLISETWSTIYDWFLLNTLVKTTVTCFHMKNRMCRFCWIAQRQLFVSPRTKKKASGCSASSKGSILSVFDQRFL